MSVALVLTIHNKQQKSTNSEYITKLRSKVKEEEEEEEEEEETEGEIPP